MEIISSFFNYLKSRDDTIIMLWEKQNGWIKHSVTDKIFDIGNIDSPEDLDKSVHEDEVYTFAVFINSVNEQINSAVYDDKNFNTATSMAVRIRCKDGIYRYCNIEVWPECQNNQLLRLFVFLHAMDPTESYRARIAAGYAAEKNPGLLNTQVVELVSSYPDKKFAAIQFDIIKFKFINEQYGVETGDELLRYISSSLKVLCSNLQVGSRLSSDIFMIITAYDTEDDITDFIDKLDSNLLGYKNMKYTIAYGICKLGDLKVSLRYYGDCAAIARQRVKGNALKHIEFYREEVKQNMLSDKNIEDQMENALQNHEFSMFLQPKCDTHEGKLIGAEALVRWIHPEHGLIPPVKFIPLFEKNGFVIKLDYYIWEEACKKISQWIQNQKNVVPISVNVSRKHLSGLDFINVLNELINKYNIPKKYLEIEITETVEDNTIDTGVSELKKNGYTLLMDDFGSGYSSLNTLKNTHFDVIKLDREFLKDLSDTERGRRIVEHTVNLIQNIGMDVIAEGVETPLQAEFLEECGCHAAQGYYYDKPLDSETFDQKYM